MGAETVPSAFSWRHYNCSLRNGQFPDPWKLADVVAVWKNKGAKSDTGNYRPISVLPDLARVLEKECASKLTVYCNNKCIIPLEQFGFRAKSSCEMALIHSVDRWLGEVDRGNFVGALLVDLSKAFDSVPYQKLLNELVSIGCSSEAVSWFSSYLSNRKQRVVVLDKKADWKEVNRGVPQGSCLSPLLFNIL